MASTGNRSVLYIGIAALIWNLIGLAAVSNDYYTVTRAPDTLSADQLAIALSLPVWGVAGTALAVVTGVLGSLGLVLRKGWSMVLFALSLIGLVAQDAGLYVALSSTGLSLDPVLLILESAIFLIAIVLLIYAGRARAAGKLA